MLNAFDEVRAMVNLMITSDKKVQNAKRIVMAVVITAIAGSALFFGLCVGANEASKEAHVDTTATNFGDVSLFTSNDGKPIATEVIETPTSLRDLFTLPSDLLDKLDKLSFTTPADPSNTNCDLDRPENEFTVSVMAYQRKYNDDNSELKLEIVTGYDTNTSGNPLIIHFEEDTTEPVNQVIMYALHNYLQVHAG
jgi:hypothetical protein